MTGRNWAARLKEACAWRDESLPLPKQRWLGWLVFYGFWTLLALMFAGQIHWIYQQSGQSTSWLKVFLESISNWYIWALFSIFIMGFTRRFPLDGPEWLRNSVLHMGASLFFSALQIVIYICIDQLGRSIDIGPGIQIRWDSSEVFDFLSRFELHMTSLFSVGILVYWAIIAFVHTTRFYRRYQEEQIRASQLEAKLAQAQLHALRTQIHPHFLFNTLNNISALISKDPESADRMLVKLSDLLRMSLEGDKEQEVELHQELDFLNRYLDIEKIRFGPRLEISMDIEQRIMDAQVPHFILQPLVENALKHGVAPNAKKGAINITGRQANGMIELVIQDNGAGLSVYQQAKLQEGIGLANTRERLRQLYGSDQQLDLRNAPEGGLVATLKIPYHTEPMGSGDPS